LNRGHWADEDSPPHFQSFACTQVTEVVPRALLEMTRSIMRSRFASIVVKRVMTFQFDRQVCFTLRFLRFSMMLFDLRCRFLFGFCVAR
jgi:hypothetical protein